MALSNGSDKIKQLEYRNAQLTSLLARFIQLEEFDKAELIEEAKEIVDKELGLK